MPKRSPNDHSAPSPSEELIGICHGIAKLETDHSISFGAIRAWMISHLSSEELRRLEERDPLWNFDKEVNDASMLLRVEYGNRIKNGNFLPPLAGMNYKPRMKLVKSE